MRTIRMWSIVLFPGLLLVSNGPGISTEDDRSKSVRFDRRNCADLAIGVPGDWVSTTDDAGAVNIMQGLPGVGLSAADDYLVSMDDFEPFISPGSGDAFGHAIAAGDFNHDYFMDLAVGLPGRTVDGDSEAGALVFFLGGRSSLYAVGYWDQDAGAIDCCDAEPEDFFGQALVSADFDNDGFDDLAVGAWGEDFSAATLGHRGMVHVFYGAASGITANGQWWIQGRNGLPGTPEDGDRFGFRLAAGDFDRDGHQDLVIGTPGENTNAGVVQVLYGTSNGPTATRNQIIDQTHFGGTREPHEYFGWALTVGNFDGDRYDDLAIGAPYENVKGIGSSGQAHVIYGSGAGLTVARTQTWHQDTEGVGGVVETGDRFGFRLAAGDFDRDGYDDLVIGVPYENHNNPGETLIAAGLVHVLYGSSSGVTAEGDDYWHQDAAGVADFARPNDKFGDALAAGDLNCDGYDDLAIGVPGEEFDYPPDLLHEGAVNVLYGSAAGLTADADQFWAQYYTEVAGYASDDDRFGSSLAVSRPRWIIFADGFESWDTSYWSATEP